MAGMPESDVKLKNADQDQRAVSRIIANNAGRTKLTRIAILIGSTRPGRNGEAVAQWVYDRAARREDATFEVVDLAKQDLPFLDEPAPAALESSYSRPHTRRWSETVASFDGYIFVL